MKCHACKKDCSVIVVAQVTVTLPVIVHDNRSMVKMNEHGKVGAKVPEKGLCSECGAVMPNPIRDLNEWQKFLNPVQNENLEQGI